MTLAQTEFLPYEKLSKKACPRKKWGQNFLHHKPTLKRIAEGAFDLAGAGKRVLEIGAGTGNLTSFLAERFASVSVLEIDHQFKDFLAQLPASVTCIWGDALEQDWPVLAPDIIVGNLPYNISVPLIFKWIQGAERCPYGIFLVQKEVGQRLVAGPSHKAYGRLSVMVQSVAHVSCFLSVPPCHFWPTPQVDSSVIVFKALPSFSQRFGLWSVLEPLVKAAFSQRRKKIKNTLLSFCELHGVKNPQAWVEKAGASMDQRAEDLSVATFLHLAQTIGQF